MGIKAPKKTIAPEIKTERNRKLYLARLHEHGLPTERVERKILPPEQFQIAQLAAAIGNRPGRKQKAYELATQALELWVSSGRILSVKDQADLLCRGLYYFDHQDWWSHARNLEVVFDDLEIDLPGRSYDRTDEEIFEAGNLAGHAVTDMWVEIHIGAGPLDILKRLFPGKGESDRSREKKFYDLVEYIKKHLAAEAITHRQFLKEAKGDALAMGVSMAWRPLGFESRKELDYIMKIGREGLANPRMFLESLAFCGSPHLVRFFAVMRMKQASEKKSRRK